MKKTARQNFLRFGVGALLSVAAGFWLYCFDFPGEKLIRASYGVPFLSRPPIKVNDVVMVYLDDESHRELGQPYNVSWDRALHARLVERLTAEGARAVAFDILFSDPHPTAPAGD